MGSPVDRLARGDLDAEAGEADIGAGVVGAKFIDVTPRSRRICAPSPISRHCLARAPSDPEGSAPPKLAGTPADPSRK